MSVTLKEQPLTLQTAVAERATPRTNRSLPPIDNQWLREYERQPDSIFQYYSVENEVDFLKKIRALPAAEQEFYITENVKRFLGEFAGKIPYTSIPYMIHGDGFNYGGMHVMDSYVQASALGGTREKTETAGFKRIEDEYVAGLAKGEPLRTAVWISPPKTADYGFVFVMQPEASGRVKEYVIRYDEKQGEVAESNRILQRIRPSLEFGTADEFLLQPQFLDPSRFRENLPALLQAAGISQDKVVRSTAFEDAVSHYLADWIGSYTRTVLEASRQSPPSQTAIDSAKSTLLALYSSSLRLKEEAERTPTSAILTPDRLPEQSVLRTQDLALAYLAMQKNAPTVTGGGSCPVVRRQDGLPGDRPSFISNSDMLNALAQGQSLEDLLRNKTFPCPKCGHAIPAGEGRTSCPKCGITKEQYAKDKAGPTCD